MTTFARKILLGSAFAVAVLATGCKNAPTLGFKNAPAPEAPAKPDNISVYPEAGVVVEEINEAGTYISSYNTVDYHEEILTKSFVVYPAHRYNVASSVQVSVPFSQIKDSTDARTVRNLKQYLKP